MPAMWLGPASPSSRSRSRHSAAAAQIVSHSTCRWRSRARPQPCCAGALNIPHVCCARRCLSRERCLDLGQRQGIDPQRLEAFSRLAVTAASDPEGALYVVSTTKLGPDAFGRKLYSNSIQTGL
jgi:hypothetical protein